MLSAIMPPILSMARSNLPDSAGKVLAVMSFPGRFVSFYISGVSEKLQNMVLMLANSVLWGLVLTTLVVLARWSFRRKV